VLPFVRQPSASGPRRRPCSFGFAGCGYSIPATPELRTGIPQGQVASSSSPDVVRAMSTELFLNFLGIRMDSSRAEGMRFTINLITPDNNEKFIIELENATLTNIK
jgi:alkyl sulfatase BDS1-like metallo-beta-lactamase superfamily hydrolase